MLKKHRRVVAGFLAVLMVVLSTFTGNVSNVQAAVDADKPVLESIELVGNTASMGNASNHTMSLKLNCYDVSGIKVVRAWVKYVDSNGKFSPNTRTIIYDSTSPTMSGDWVFEKTNESSNGMNCTFEGNIDLNIYPDAGTVVVTEVEIVDQQGNTFSSSRETDNSLIINCNPDGGWKWDDLSFYKVKESFGNATPMSQYTLDSVTYQKQGATVSYSRNGHGFSVNGNIQPITNELSTEYALIMNTVINTSSNPNFNVEDYEAMYAYIEDTDHLNFCYNSWNQSIIQELGNGLYNFTTFTWISKDSFNGAPNADRVKIKKLYLKKKDGGMEAIDLGNAPYDTGVLYTNWHVGVDCSTQDLKISDVKYYVNGSTNPYDKNDANSKFLHYGDKVAVEVKTDFPIGNIAVDKILIRMDGYQGNWFLAEASNISGTNTYRAEFTLDDQLSTSMWWATDIVYLKDTASIYYSIDYSTRYEKSFLIQADDGSIFLPTENVRFSAWYGAYGNDRIDVTAKIVPGVSTTDDFYAELDKQKVDSIEVRNGTLNFTGWKLYELTWDGTPGPNNFPTRRPIERGEKEILYGQGSSGYVARATYDKTLIHLNVSYIKEDGNYGFSYPLGFENVSELKAFLKRYEKNLLGSDFLRWDVVKWEDGKEIVICSLDEYDFGNTFTNNEYLGLSLKASYKNPLCYLSTYYYDEKNPDYPVGYDWSVRGITSEDGSEFVSEANTKYANAFPQEIGFKGYEIEKIDNQYSDLPQYSLTPITEKKVLNVIQNEVVGNELVDTYLKENVIVSEDEVETLVKELKTTATHRANGEKFVEWQENTYGESFYVMSEIYPKFEGKNIIIPSYSYDDRTQESIPGKQVILVDENASLETAKTIIIEELNKLPIKEELGIDAWYLRGEEDGWVENRNWEYFSFDANATKPYISYLVEHEDGFVTEYKVVEIGDEIVYPTKIGKVTNIKWTDMGQSVQNETSWWYEFFTEEDKEFWPTTIRGNITRLTGEGTLVNNTDTPPKDDDVKEEQPVENPEEPTSSDTTQTQNEEKKEELITTKSGEDIKVNTDNKAVAEVLAKAVGLSETFTQEKADSWAKQIEAMPKESSVNSGTKVDDNGNTVVTETVQLGTKDLVVNEKGELTLSDSVVEDIKNSIDEVINQTSEGTPEVILELGAASVIPETIFEEAKGCDVNIVIKKDGYYWTINGNDIAASQPVAINFEVEVDREVIPQGLIEDLAGNKPTTQLSLSHNGTFGLKAKLTVELGDKGKANAGLYGNLYYHDSEGKLVFQNSGQITPDGTVSLDFSHASDYVIIIDEDQTPKDDGVSTDKDTSAPADTTVENLGQVESSSQVENSNGGMMILIPVLVLILLAIGIAVVVLRKKATK